MVGCTTEPEEYSELEDNGSNQEERVGSDALG